ncbi:unnamed protein product, partial [Symbiodinium microadriaticum]
SALKRRKTLGVAAGHLTYIVGREAFHFCRSLNPIEAKPHKYLTMPVLLKYDSKNQKKDPNAKALNDTEVVQHAAEIGDEELQPLNYLGRHGSLHKELWHLMDVGRLVTFSPEFNQLAAAMEQRLFTIALVRSSLHEDLLKKELVDWVSQELQRPSNERFYRSHLAPPQRDTVEVAPNTSMRREAPVTNDTGNQGGRQDHEQDEDDEAIPGLLNNPEDEDDEQEEVEEDQDQEEADA